MALNAEKPDISFQFWNWPEVGFFEQWLQQQSSRSCMESHWITSTARFLNIRDPCPGMHLYNICKAAATIPLTQTYGIHGRLLCRSHRFLRTVHPAGLGRVKNLNMTSVIRGFFYQSNHSIADNSAAPWRWLADFRTNQTIMNWRSPQTLPHNL